MKQFLPLREYADRHGLSLLDVINLTRSKSLKSFQSPEGVLLVEDVPPPVAGDLGRLDDAGTGLRVPDSTPETPAKGWARMIILEGSADSIADLLSELRR